MLRSDTVATQAMAKVQKTVMVLEDLHRVACEFEIKTGANFTRIVTAALLEYLIEGLPPHPRWMSYAVALERGDTTLTKILLDVHDRLVSFAENGLERAKHVDLPEGTTNPFLEDAERRLRLYHAIDSNVDELREGDHSIDSFIACWQKISGQYAAYAVPPDLKQ